MEKRRVLVIGLDGATFDLIDPLAAEGHLPTFRGLLVDGARAQLMSTVPPATIPAWPSFMTGKSPGRHGVFDFFKRDSQDRRQLVSSRDIEGPTLWRVLTDHGRRSIVLNVPCTYPPEPLDGVVVSGMLTPAEAEYVHPSQTALDLNTWTGGYRINPRSEYVKSPVDRAELIGELKEVSEIQKHAFLELLDREAWDFSMLMFRATDVVQHKLWHRKGDVAQLYAFLDGLLAEIVEAAGDASIWLMSDHGFGPLHKLFHVNQWLRDHGWLAIQRKAAHASQKTDSLTRRGMSGRVSVLHRLAAQLGLTKEWARSTLPTQLHAVLKRLSPGQLRRSLPDSNYGIDWSRTRVYNDSLFTQETQALRINLKGRDPQGTVHPIEFEKLRDEVIQALQTLRDGQTGQPVVARLHRGDQLFAGPYVENAPDLVLELRDGYKMINDFVAKEWLSAVSPVGGCHRREGIFVAAGPDIAGGEALDHLNIVDLMPTILHYMGLPVPTACDGKVRRDVFDAQSDSAARPVIYEDAAYTPRVGEAEVGQDDEEVVSRLRALGYIE